jgi:hypothetical protein
MSTCWIAGNASNGFWDTAGESVNLEGMDISSLENSVCNWEHKSEKPSDYVGRIVKAKKIFKISDCANELELKYWLKCQVPFLFCLVKLFNDTMPAAREVAGIFEESANNPELPGILGFSIEGAKVETNSGVITKSIARKLSLTANPANKACVASKVDLSAPDKTVDPLSFMFKSQTIELIYSEKLEVMQKSIPLQPKAPKPGLKQAPENQGMSIGQTASGKHVMSHEKVHNYTDFSPEDHRNASVLHSDAATKANANKDYQLADHHNQKMKLHNSAAAGLERKANRFANGLKTHADKAAAKDILGKAEEAGSGLVASGNKTQGAALQKEYASDAQRKWAHTTKGVEALGGEAAVHEWDEKSKGKKLPKKVKKSKWLARAEEAYDKWDKKADFESFMQKRMPHLAKGEIRAIGQTLALKKNIDAEKSLETMMGSCLLKDTSKK